MSMGQAPFAQGRVKNYATCAHIRADRYRDRRNLLLFN